MKSRKRKSVGLLFVQSARLAKEWPRDKFVPMEVQVNSKRKVDKKSDLSKSRGLREQVLSHRHRVEIINKGCMMRDQLEVLYNLR